MSEKTSAICELEQKLKSDITSLQETSSRSETLKVKHATELKNMKDKLKKMIKSRYNRRYREKNKDKTKQYYDKNKEHILKQQREYRAKNVDKLKEYHKNYWKEKSKNNKLIQSN